MSLTIARAEEILSAFKTKKVLTVGDAFIDSYHFGVVKRLNPEDSLAPLLNVTRTEYRSGGAGNVARNIASLGAKRSVLLAIRGQDKRGSHLLKIGKSEGYKSYLVPDTRRTIEKNRPINEANKPLARLDFETEAETRPIGEVTMQSLLNHARAIVPNVDGILISDYAKGLITQAFSEKFLALATQHGTPVLADIKPAQAGYFVGVDMMAPNLKEATASVGMSLKDEAGQIASLLAKRFATVVFLTAGAKGICIADSAGASVIMVPQKHSRPVADSSGCGDTAAATILLAKLSGATSEEAAELANAAAAVTVGEPGAYAPTPEEVLRMLAS